MLRDGWIPDATQINAFRRCPEFFRLRHVKGLIKPGREGAPESGEGWHAALRCWFDGKSVAECLLELAKSWPAIATFSEHKEKRPLELFQRMFTAYIDKYPRSDDSFKVERNEEYLAGNFPAFNYCGIVDRVITFDSSSYVMDSKSTGMWVNAGWFEAFEMSQQMIGYVALEQANGRECAGYFIDAVHVDTRYHKVKPENFVRYGPIKVPEWKLDNWKRSVEMTLAQIKWFWDNYGPDEVWEQREQGCKAWNKWCGFWSSPAGQQFPGLCRSPQELHSTLMEEYDERFWEPAERAKLDSTRPNT